MIITRDTRPPSAEERLEQWRKAYQEILILNLWQYIKDCMDVFNSVYHLQHNINPNAADKLHTAAGILREAVQESKQ